MFGNLGRFAFRWRWAIVSFWAVALLASLPVLPRVEDVLQVGGFSSPHGLWVDSKGNIYVGEVTHTALSRYDRWHEGCHSIVKYARI